MDKFLLLLIAFFAANMPFFSERIFFIVTISKKKNLVWRLLELCLLYFIVGGIAWFLESRATPVYKQNWEFYVITFCLFLVLAYPGFIYRYLWKKSEKDGFNRTSN